MDTICIDIDNKTPGAILIHIVGFILPECLQLANGDGDIICLHTLNKYFHKTVQYCRPACKVKKFCGLLVCRKHSANITDLRIIHGRIQQALRHVDIRWIHFDSLELSHKARPFVEKTFGYNLRTCCSGKGYAIRPSMAIYGI